MDTISRRTFLSAGVAATVSLVLPALTGCAARPSSPLDIPFQRPEGWDPIAFNRDRGNAGAIPESYRPDINGPSGATDHIGKHLPYVPRLDPGRVPNGTIPLMWGDPSAGHAPHPNSRSGTWRNRPDHWYDWIRIRKATWLYAETVESRFSGWPETADTDTGRYAVSGSHRITDDHGIHTIYLVRLPSDVTPGDALRIHAHCLTHGEYVDFLVLGAS